MIVFMFRPSPQCPKPSIHAAMRCYPACEYNIYMHQAQIQNGNVDMTWIFTQAMFMNVNTILWTLSFEEIRIKYIRQDVEKHLQVALECIKTASERWPGVISAVELYKALIPACLRIYDKKGDVEISVGSPIESTSGYESRSNTTSPVSKLAQYVAPPPHQQSPNPGSLGVERGFNSSASGSIGFGQSLFGSPGSPPSNNGLQSSPSYSGFHHPSDASNNSLGGVSNSTSAATPLFDPALSAFEAASQLPLPSTFNNLDIWNPNFDFTSGAPMPTVPALARFDSNISSFSPGPPASPSPHLTISKPAPLSFSTEQLNNVGIPTNIPFGAVSPSNVPWTDYLYPPSADTGPSDLGLTEEQQQELMDSLSGKGLTAIQGMLDASNRLFYPAGRAPM
jgi:hypothetical protein